MHIASCCLRQTTPIHVLFTPKNIRTKFWKLLTLQYFVLCHSPWQAIFLEIGSAARFMRLEKKEHMTLWNAILKSDLDTFSQVKEKLPFCTKFPWTCFLTAVAVSKQEKLWMFPTRCEHAQKKKHSCWSFQHKECQWSDAQFWIEADVHQLGGVQKRSSETTPLVCGFHTWLQLRCLVAQGTTSWWRWHGQHGSRFLELGNATTPQRWPVGRRSGDSLAGIASSTWHASILAFSSRQLLGSLCSFGCSYARHFLRWYRQPVGLKCKESREQMYSQRSTGKVFGIHCFAQASSSWPYWRSSSCWAGSSLESGELRGIRWYPNRPNPSRFCTKMLGPPES